MEEFIRKNWPRYLFMFMYTITQMLLYVGLRNSWLYPKVYCDSLGLAGLVIVCIGVLTIINNMGGFDIFQLMVAKRDKNGRRPTLYDYSTDKKQKREKYKFVCFHYFAFGVFLICLSLIWGSFYRV